MKFSIVYKDLSVVKGTTRKQWDLAPQNDVLHVITPEGICRPSEYYLPIDGDLNGSNTPNSLLHMFPQIKFGITVDNKTFNKASKLAKEEMKFMCGGCK